MVTLVNQLAQVLAVLIVQETAQVLAVVVVIHYVYQVAQQDVIQAVQLPTELVLLNLQVNN